MSACAVKRLAAELRGVERDPPPYITPRPLPSDILKWYFVIRGPKDTPYETGIYMGKLVFPEDYPFKPPDFHPETWNPVWSVSAVLTGLLSFMVGTEDTFGSIGTSEFEKIKMAKCSHEFNQKDRIFKELFPDFIRNGVERGIPGGTSGDSVKTESSSLPESDSRTGKPREESELALIWWIAVLIALCFGAWKVCSVIGASMP